MAEHYKRTVNPQSLPKAHSTGGAVVKAFHRNRLGDGHEPTELGPPGPCPCIHGGGFNHPMQPHCKKEEPQRILGTSVYCATCGQGEGITTVGGLPETEEEWEHYKQAWRQRVIGTPLEWTLDLL